VPERVQEFVIGVDAMAARFHSAERIIREECARAMGVARAWIHTTRVALVPKGRGELMTALYEDITIDRTLKRVELRAGARPPMEAIRVFVDKGTGIYAGHPPWAERTEQGNLQYHLGQRPQPFEEEALDSNRRTVVALFRDAGHRMSVRLSR